MSERSTNERVKKKPLSKSNNNTSEENMGERVIEEALKEYNKLDKESKGYVHIIIYIISFILLFTIVWFSGDLFGKKVGIAYGSYEGLTEGLNQGYQDGKETGKSAEDMEIRIINEFEKIRKLEVLITSVKFTDMNQYGDDVKYAALYLLKGNAVFTVDLSRVEIQFVDESIVIKVPKPEVELHIENSQIQKVADYQKMFFNGSAEDGFDDYLNSMDKIQKNAEEKISNYGTLEEIAEKEAERIITQMIQTVSLEGPRNIIFEFMQGDIQ